MNQKKPTPLNSVGFFTERELMVFKQQQVGVGLKRFYRSKDLSF